VCSHAEFGPSYSRFQPAKVKNPPGKPFLEAYPPDLGAK